MNTPLDTVRGFYNAVARGDIPAVLGLLDERVEWTERFPCYSGTWRGGRAIVDSLFVPLSRDWDGFSVRPREFVAEGDRVVAVGAYSGTYKKSGRSLSTDFTHVWTVRDGKVLKFDQHTDTAKVLEALAPVSRDKAGPSPGPQEAVFYQAGARPDLHHASVYVADLDVAVRFYTEGLGLTVRKWFTDIVSRRGAGDVAFGLASVFLEAGNGLYVELHPAGQGDLLPPGFPLNHLAFGVADVDGAYSRALEAGGRPYDIHVAGFHWDGTPLDVEMAGQYPEPMRMAFLLGPNRELIELYQSLH
jgi:ketosteroid isomerase-like protein/catechol 2,3-dioxygenase-like lactoylglutathione lyase family enzyme